MVVVNLSQHYAEDLTTITDDPYYRCISIDTFPRGNTTYGLLGPYHNIRNQFPMGCGRERAGAWDKSGKAGENKYHCINCFKEHEWRERKYKYIVSMTYEEYGEQTLQEYTESIRIAKLIGKVDSLCRIACPMKSYLMEQK